jgi:hypothetical protein
MLRGKILGGLGEFLSALNVSKELMAIVSLFCRSAVTMKLVAEQLIILAVLDVEQRRS